MQVRRVGTLFARGRRTVAAALRQLGRHAATNFSRSPHGLSRARWSALEVSRRRLHLRVRTLVAVGGELTVVIAATLERRWGRRLTRRRHAREPLASRQHRSVAASGWRWLVLTPVMTPPWTPRPWALPVLSGPAPTPEVSRRWGRRHKTVPQRARQRILVVRRWLPGVELTGSGDHTYSVHDRGGACARWGVRLLAPRRLEAALYAPAPPRRPDTTGRPRVKGKRLPQLKPVLKEAPTIGPRGRVRWDNGRRRELDVTSGTAVWYRLGQPVLPGRWVIVRAPRGQRDPRAYVSTGPSARPRDLVRRVVHRGTIETTVEESRAHLGLETQRQWSDRAMARPTPCLVGLDAGVARLAHALPPDGKIPVRRTACYHQAPATCGEVLAGVRQPFWGALRDSPSAHDPDLGDIPWADRSRLAQAVCDSH